MQQWHDAFDEIIYNGLPSFSVETPSGIPESGDGHPPISPYDAQRGRQAAHRAHTNLHGEALFGSATFASVRISSASNSPARSVPKCTTTLVNLTS